MGGKFSKKISRKVLLQGIGLFIFFATATTLLFQNCSQVSVSDLTLPAKEAEARILRIGAGEVVVEVGASQYDKAEAQFQVGLDTVPALKQMWIVDNSGSMEANNLNLSTSFSAMFDQSNQDSLYKFDTTAYLFSTAQTVPSFVSGTAAEKTLLNNVASLQNLFLSQPTISESVFDNDFRKSTENSGKIPGDNLGIEVRKVASLNDFSIKAAPVLTKKLNSGAVVLTAGVTKPANTNTLAFENEFKDKLNVLQSARIPLSLVDGKMVQQNAPILDKESGLCAIARILDNPNSMFSKSDLLSFNIVTDENDNDPTGANCLKRTAVLSNTEKYVNGRCSEFETPFHYSISTTSTASSSCTITGKKGYEAQFDYSIYSADITWRTLDVPATTRYTTPKTRIVFSTPKTKTQQRQTNVLFYNQSCTANSTLYRRRTTPVTYFTQTCTKFLSDGLEKTVCKLNTNGSTTGYVYGDQRSAAACKAAALSLNPNAITEVRDAITADKLPSCNVEPAFGTFAATPTCSVADSANCQTQMVNSVCSITGTQKSEWIVGDRAANCKAAALEKSPTAATVVRDSITETQMPSCPIVRYNDVACNPSTDVNCQSVPDGLNTNNTIYVYGTIQNGTTACTNHSSLPAGATNVNCDTLASYAESNIGACPASQVAFGCTAVTTPEKTKLTSVSKQLGIKNETECRAWARAQPNHRIQSDNDIACNKFYADPASVKSTILFASSSDGGTTLAVGADCGASRNAFFNALSTSDKSKVTAANSCKISAITSGTLPSIPMTGVDCVAQKVKDCSDARFREPCSTSQIPGSSSTVTTAEVAHGMTAMKATCDSKCNTLPNGFCEGYKAQPITVREYFNLKYGAKPNVVVNCSARTPIERSPAIETFAGRLESQIPSFCPVSDTGVPRYYLQSGNAYTTTAATDEFVSGSISGSSGQIVPEKNLIDFIKAKIAQNELNAVFTVFIRRTGEAVGTGNLNYIGTHYEKLVQETSGQAYSVTATSYSEALRNLSSVIRSKLIRSFTVNAIDPSRHVITKVTIVRNNGSQTLALGEWTQSGKTITVVPNVAFNEGDRVIVEFQNNDGFIKDQLKKIFVINEMRPDQIVISVQHIKSSGESVLLNTDQWLKDGNKLAIDPSVVINGGDQFRVKFKNNTTEE